MTSLMHNISVNAYVNTICILGGIKIGNGAGKIVSEEPYLTTSAEAAGIVGREPDRLAIVLAGARELALATQGIAARRGKGGWNRNALEA